MHSKKFSKIKDWYHLGMWSEARVRNAVDREWITAEEYEEIVGKKIVVSDELVREAT